MLTKKMMLWLLNVKIDVMEPKRYSRPQAVSGTGYRSMLSINSHLPLSTVLWEWSRTIWTMWWWQMVANGKGGKYHQRWRWNCYKCMGWDGLDPILRPSPKSWAEMIRCTASWQRDHSCDLSPAPLVYFFPAGVLFFHRERQRDHFEHALPCHPNK